MLRGCVADADSATSALAVALLLRIWEARWQVISCDYLFISAMRLNDLAAA